MAKKGKMTTLGLALIAALMVSVILVNAESISPKNQEVKNKSLTQCKPASTVSISTANKVQIDPNPTNIIAPACVQIKDREVKICRCEPGSGSIQIEDELEAERFDEEIIDRYVEDYELLEPEEIPEDEPPRRCIWIVMSRGYSWETEPTTDSVEPRIPMVLRFTAKPVMDTGDGVLFKVLRGIVGHEDERHEIEGYGWLRKDDGIFYMKLEGEDIWFRVVGKVYPRLDVAADCVRRFRFHLVVMKGEMGVEGIEYLFALKGRAFRVCLCSCDTLVKPEEAMLKSTTS